MPVYKCVYVQEMDFYENLKRKEAECVAFS